MATNRFKLALIQLAVGASKAENLKRASQLISKAAQQGANLISLPECCNSPYGNDYFPQYAEPIPGQSTESFAKAAKDNNVFLVAGSIPERVGESIYNTSAVFNPQGEMIAKHRKIHLFDIDIPGKITFQESKTLTAGDSVTTFDTPFGKVGLAICYDIRFPELGWIMAQRGCKLLLYPGAFNMTTGPAHWQLLARARAVDNQLYVASISPARDESATYRAWGHSVLVNPWGEIVCEAGHSEEILYADLETEFLEQVRNQVPTSKQKRADIYEIVDKTK